MKVVNLSRRPFTNRRPVARLATLFWLLGGVLLLVNVWLYASHFSGSSKGRGRLDALARQVDQEQDRLGELGKELRKLDLDSRNRKARYLNSLIHSRTFPWSALFDDLEDTLPIDVYLGSVQPSLKLAKQPRTSAQPRRATTAREARARARAAARGEAAGQPTTAIEPEEEEFFSGDRVALTIRGYARSDEAMFEFVDRLYQDPSFKDPNLSRESKNKAGTVNFNIKVIYLTPKKGANPPEEGMAGAETSVDGSRSNGPGTIPRVVVDAREGDTGDDARPLGSEVSVADPGTRAETEPVRSSRSRLRDRDVRRAEPQHRADLPPEEGELEGEEPRRRSRSTGSRSRTTGSIPSTVSVAPGFTQAPGATTPDPGREAEDFRRPEPSNERGPSTRPTRPGRTTPRGTPDPLNPIPTQPAASSSPRLQGSLFDRWIPDFLRWTPDYSGFIDSDRAEDPLSKGAVG